MNNNLYDKFDLNAIDANVNMICNDVHGNKISNMGSMLKYNNSVSQLKKYITNMNNLSYSYVYKMLLDISEYINKHDGELNNKAVEINDNYIRLSSYSRFPKITVNGLIEIIIELFGGNNIYYSINGESFHIHNVELLYKNNGSNRDGNIINLILEVLIAYLISITEIKLKETLEERKVL